MPLCPKKWRYSISWCFIGICTGPCFPGRKPSALLIRFVIRSSWSHVARYLLRNSSSSSHWLSLISISSSISKTKEVNLCCVWKSRYRLLLALVSYARVRIKLRCNNVASSSLSENCHLYECHFWRKTYVAFPILLNKCQQNLLVDRGSRHHCHWDIAEQPRRMFRSWDIQNGQKCWLCRSELPRTKLGRKQDRHTQRQGGDNMIQAGARVVSSSQQVVRDWWQCAVVARYSVWDTQHR